VPTVLLPRALPVGDEQEDLVPGICPRVGGLRDHRGGGRDGRGDGLRHGDENVREERDQHGHAPRVRSMPDTVGGWSASPNRMPQEHGCASGCVTPGRCTTSSRRTSRRTHACSTRPWCVHCPVALCPPWTSGCGCPIPSSS